MRKFGAFLVSVVLVFPAAVLAIAGIVGLLGSLADITMSASMQVLLSGACLFVSIVVANMAYYWIIRRMDETSNE